MAFCFIYPPPNWMTPNNAITSDQSKVGPKKLAIGIFTMDKKVELRQTIRSINDCQLQTDFGYKYFFVIGRPSAAYQLTVQQEIEQYEDIIVLDIKENMNEGKTFDFFKHVTNDPDLSRYEYVGKFDDDLFIVVPNFEPQMKRFDQICLKSKQRWCYIGIPAEFEPDQYKYRYFCGFAQILSMNLAKQMVANSQNEQNKIGQEDYLMTVWLRTLGSFDQQSWIEMPKETYTSLNSEDWCIESLKKSKKDRSDKEKIWCKQTYNTGNISVIHNCKKHEHWTEVANSFGGFCK
eukprot:28176_1